ncbi:MAG TPA: hypothetical protein VEF53_07820, partial [Patescibacteria group bacterium]|nr:hypothetical protein [Patescibacteria group bacterium]
MMKCIRWKSFVMGMVFMLVISIVFIPAFADYVTKTINVQTGLKVYSDDQLVTFTDANGNPVEAFMYNGTTYLPVRASSNLFGKAIVFDGKSQSIFIGKHESSEIQGYLGYDVKSVFNSNPTYYTGWSGCDNLGNIYTKGIGFTDYEYTSDTGYVEWNLDAK